MARGTVSDLELLKALSIQLGYSFVISKDGQEERMIRPDGTVALIARIKREKAERP